MKVILKNISDVIQGKATIGAIRSSKWPTTRKRHLERNPTCAVCNGVKKLEVHHIQPFNVKPELELDSTNLITLCESKSYGIVCHLAVGNLGNYKTANPTVKSDAKFWNKRLKKKRV